MIKEYLDYLRDNPQHYWFKAKLFGWGWTPARWQGWLVILAYLALLLGLVSTIDENSPKSEVDFMFWLPLAILTAALIAICYKTGEKPRWNWGFPKKDEKAGQDK